MAHRKAECKNCGRVKWVAGRGMCGACYARLHRKGTLERKNDFNKGRICKKAECSRPAFAKGFCPHHYQKARHPLSSTWRLLRSRMRDGGFPESWMDFDVFLQEVGDRPTPKHRLIRKDQSKPYSRANVEWQSPIYAGSNSPEYHGPYSKAWNLKKSYGLTVEQYGQMLDAQNGVCATCRNPETSIEHRSGNVRALIVDHCHTTEANGTIQDSIRGLLCNRCNRLLGLARDESELLRNLASYLDHHRALKSA